MRVFCLLFDSFVHYLSWSSDSCLICPNLAHKFCSSLARSLFCLNAPWDTRFLTFLLLVLFYITCINLCKGNFQYFFLRFSLVVDIFHLYLTPPPRLTHTHTLTHTFRLSNSFSLPLSLSLGGLDLWRGGDSGRMMEGDGTVWSITAEIQSPHSLCEAYGEHMAGVLLPFCLQLSCSQRFGLEGSALMMVQNNLPLRSRH